MRDSNIRDSNMQDAQMRPASKSRLFVMLFVMAVWLTPVFATPNNRGSNNPEAQKSSVSDQKETKKEEDIKQALKAKAEANAQEKEQEDAQLKKALKAKADKKSNAESNTQAKSQDNSQANSKVNLENKQENVADHPLKDGLKAKKDTRASDPKIRDQKTRETGQATQQVTHTQVTDTQVTHTQVTDTQIINTQATDTNHQSKSTQSSTEKTSTQSQAQQGIDPATRLLLQRPVITTVRLSHRGLLVVDEDPSNDQLSFLTVSASGRAYRAIRLFGSLGLRQSYSVEPDESPVQLADLTVGASLPMAVPLTSSLNMALFHAVLFTLPTSRQSLAQDLIFAPQYFLSASIMPLPNVVIAATPNFRYRFHQYAERAGFGGGMNTQLDFGASLGADYLIGQTAIFSTYRLGASLGTSYAKRYSSTEEFESLLSDQSFWNQLYRWEAHAVYTPTFQFSVSLSVEHNSGVRRNGIVNMFFAHRDETEVVLTLSGRY